LWQVRAACLPTLALACSPAGASDDGRAIAPAGMPSHEGSSSSGADPSALDARPGTSSPPSNDASSDAGHDAPDDSEPRVDYIGRFERLPSGAMRDGFPASRVVVHFEGPSLGMTVTGVRGPGTFAPHYDLIVDGVVSPEPVVTREGTHPLSLARGLSSGRHTVELFKRSESSFGSTEFGALHFDAGGRLLAPPARPARRIEVLSHSAANGYGIEGPGPTCRDGATAATANARKTAPHLVATELGAELRLLGYSGKGIVRPLDTVTFPGLFERVRPESATPPWAHGAWIPDALVSFSLSFADLDESDVVLTNAYAAFVERIRSVYPTTHVFLVVSAYSVDSYPVGKMGRTRTRAIHEEIVRRRRLAGDLRVYAYAMQPYVDGQLTGCDYHPGVELHRQMAAELAPWLRARLGW